MKQKPCGSKLLGVAVFICLSLVLVRKSPAPPILPPGPSDFQVTAYAYTPTLCSITAGDLTFPDYDYRGGADQSGTSTVVVNCSSGRGYTLYPDDGLNLSGGTRRMAFGGANFLNYGLYKENSHSQAWGASLADQYSGTGSGVDQSLTIYGNLPGSQNVPDGTYLDTVTMVVEYTP